MQSFRIHTVSGLVWNGASARNKNKLRDARSQKGQPPAPVSLTAFKHNLCTLLLSISQSRICSLFHQPRAFGKWDWKQQVLSCAFFTFMSHLNTKQHEVLQQRHLNKITWDKTPSRFNFFSLPFLTLVSLPQKDTDGDSGPLSPPT